MMTASILADTAEDQNFESNGLELNDTQTNFVPRKPRLRHSLETLSPMATTTTVLDLQNTTQLTFSSIFALIVGGVIGSGIFSSPSQVDQNVPSPGVAILVWIIGGLIAWAGAASFAELGAAIPDNGGMLEYLSYIYGDLLAAIMSWTWIMAVKPSSMAVLSTIFAEYWTSIIVSSGSEHFWLNKLLAVATLGSMVLVNALGSKHSTRLIDLLLFIKLMTVASVVTIAILVAAFNLTADGKWPSQDWRTRNWFARREKDISGSTIDWATIDSWELLGYYTNALYAGLWSYSGWDSVSSLFRLWVCLDGSKLTWSG
jgi:L-type amino acid transporter 9